MLSKQVFQTKENEKKMKKLDIQLQFTNTTFIPYLGNAI